LLTGSSTSNFSTPAPKYLCSRSVDSRIIVGVDGY
jgi:hypothetical protein